MKKCFKCGIEQPLDSFYKHPQMADGHVNKCKTCNKKDVQNNYQKNREYFTEYDKRRNSLPHRVEARKQYQEWLYQNDPDRKRQYQKNSYARHAGEIYEKTKLYRQRFPTLLRLIAACANG